MVGTSEAASLVTISSRLTLKEGGALIDCEKRDASADLLINGSPSTVRGILAAIEKNRALVLAFRGGSESIARLRLAAQLG